MDYLTEYIIILIYLLLLIGIGYAFRQFNQNTSDYIRSGGQASWWLVGTSSLMGSISAFTFTGNAGAIFKAGWTPLIIYFANTAAFLVAAICLAAWFRQTRAQTVPEIYRERFGPEVEQFTSYLGLIMGTIGAAIWLWGLATFSSAVFAIPVIPLIWGLGLVTLLYSMTGGRWAVMGTDFLQSLILFPITIVIAVLCLYHIGGPLEFLKGMNGSGSQADFRWVYAEGAFPGNAFTWDWIGGIIILQFFGGLSLHNAGRYLSVKDSGSARKAALLSGVLMLLGGIIWMVPPAVARMLMENEVMAVALKNPEEASYAVIARELLPNGLLGIMVVAMFAATMSSMDSGLNGTAGIFIRNVLPPLRRLCRKEQLGEVRALLISRFVTFLSGLFIILLAHYFTLQDGLGLFDMMMKMVSVFGMPTMIPMIYCIFIRRLPRWSFFFSAACGAVPVILSLWSELVYQEPWTFQERAISTFVVGSIGLFLTIPLYTHPRWTSEAYRRQVDGFFLKMKTPVNFGKEIGECKDNLQLQILGKYSMISGAFVLLLLMLPNPLWGRACILFVSGVVMLIGFLMYRSSSRTH